MYNRYRKFAFLASSLFSIVFLLFLILRVPLGKAYTSRLLLIYAGVFLLSYLISRFKSKKAQAKKKSKDSDADPLEIYNFTFLSDGIQYSTTQAVTPRILPYAEIHRIFETPNYFILVLASRKLLPIEKSSICGGPVSTFIQLLLDASPSIKRKKLSSLLPGKIIRCVFAVLLAVSMFLGILWSTPAQNLLYSGASINASMTYQQIADELEELGIHDIPQEVLTDLAHWDSEYDTRIPQNGVYKCINLLCMAGMGTYHDETWQWTPAQTGVFWFDAEAFNITSMYTDLLLGVQALAPETLRFTDIQEDFSLVNCEEGSGTETVTFTFAGKTHTLSADVMYDWYDIEFLNDLNRIIQKETGNSLYFAWDQCQGFLVFYGDHQWAVRFQQATGISLKKNILLLEALY